MKPILKNMLVSFATGASFALGICVVVISYQLVNTSGDVEPSTKIFAPEDLTILEHDLVPDREKLTVHGVVENSGDNVWPFAFLELRVYAGRALMSGCNVDLIDVQPNSRQQFEVVCSTTQGRNLPDNISYVVEIPWGWRLD